MEMNEWNVSQKLTVDLFCEKRRSGHNVFFIVLVVVMVISLVLMLNRTCFHHRLQGLLICYVFFPNTATEKVGVHFRLRLQNLKKVIFTEHHSLHQADHGFFPAPSVAVTLYFSSHPKSKLDGTRGDANLIRPEDLI